MSIISITVNQKPCLLSTITLFKEPTVPDATFSMFLSLRLSYKANSVPNSFFCKKKSKFFFLKNLDLKTFCFFFWVFFDRSGRYGY